MDDLLTPLLEHHVAGRGVAGLAVIGGSEEGVQTLWTPATLPQEPLFLAYSITKSFTATLFLLLQERGEVSLDAPLFAWFPDLPGAHGMTLRQVLSHTAGLPDYGTLPAYNNAVRTSPSHPWTFDQFMEKTLAHGLAFETGEDWGYSNLGYMLLKRIAELITGGRFADLLRNFIIRPLVLQRTFVPESLEDLAPLSPSFSFLLSPDGSPVDIREHYHPGWVSHGVVASTPSEIARFFDALFRGRILSPRSLEEMTTLLPVPIYDSDSPWNRPSYGLGLMGDPESPFGPIFGHNGGGPGYNASVYYAPLLGENGLTVCVMGGIEKEFEAEKVVVGVMEVAIV